MHQNHLSFQNSNITYHIGGKGQLVFLLHGFGYDSTIWQQQANVLEAYCTVIVPDLPGSGQSDFIIGANMNTYAGIIKAIAEKESSNDDAFTIIGHSMGGYIALAFAEKYPHLIKGLGLFHSTAYADSSEKIAAREKAIQFIKNNGAFAFIKEAIPANFSPQFATNHVEVVTNLVVQADTISDDTLIQYYQAMIERPDRTATLTTSTYPILFVIGQYDAAIPMQQILPQSHLPNISVVHILQQSGHMGMLEEADKANGLLVNFVCNQF
jgi:pimeloyl-ACP methyl ester carboxylesterase